MPYTVPGIVPSIVDPNCGGNVPGIMKAACGFAAAPWGCGIMTCARISVTRKGTLIGPFSELFLHAVWELTEYTIGLRTFQNGISPYMEDFF